MPWEIKHDTNLCPSSKPWALVKQTTGKLVACHPTKVDAGQQLKALYVHEGNSMKPYLEQRCNPLAPELRVQAGSTPKIVGYAAVFGQLSQPIFGFREKIAPGAFKRALESRADVRALVNHDPSMILGRSKAGTLQLKEDGIGLMYEIDPPDTQAGRDIITSLRRGDIDQSSFGFSAKDEGWSKDEQGKPIRELRDVDLFDISLVTFPAYNQTSVGLRSLWPNSDQEEIENWIEMMAEITNPEEGHPNLDACLSKHPEFHS